MTSNENIGSAILIVAAVYLYFALHIPDWAAWLMVLLGATSLVYVSTDKDSKKLALELIKAKTDYYRSRTKKD